MNYFISDFFTREKKPVRGLLPIEWAMFLYMGFTFLMILLTYTKLVNPQSMLIGRVQIAIITMALWGVYRLLPCRFIKVIRSFVQMGLLVWWYPDTYELNRVLPNLDHLFATWEQQLFGMQPALAFAQHFSSPIISELMDMGYASYYPMVAAVPLFYLFFSPKRVPTKCLCPHCLVLSLLCHLCIAARCGSYLLFQSHRTRTSNTRSIPTYVRLFQLPPGLFAQSGIPRGLLLSSCRGTAATMG